MSRSAKRTHCDYAEEETAEEKISTERTNQGERARLDRHSAPKKAEEKPLKHEMNTTRQQRERRKRTNQTKKKANEKDKKNRKKQA